MAASSSNRHHRPHLVDQQGLPPVQLLPTEGKAVEEETRDWANLPLEMLLDVLRRLNVVDILKGPGKACRPWRRASREEPELWRHIDIRHRDKVWIGVDLLPAALAAVRRSLGRCEAFWADRLDVDRDHFALFLADSAPQLKSLRLIECESDMFSDDLSNGIRKFHMLEKLELSLHSESHIPSHMFNLDETCRAVAEGCPLLKCLRLNKFCFYKRSRIGDAEAIEIGKMRSLQFLQLFANSIGNFGFMTILRGCVRLEYLDIRHCFNVDIRYCFNVEMDDELRAACDRLHTLRLPRDSVDDYNLRFGSPDMAPRRRVIMRNVGNDWASTY